MLVIFFIVILNLLGISVLVEEYDDDVDWNVKLFL